MEAEQKRRLKRKKYMKLRNHNTWVTVLVFLFASVICASLLVFLVSLIAQLSVESKLGSAGENARSLAGMYSTGGEEVLSLFDAQGITYELVDENGNVLHQNGRNTRSQIGGYYERSGIGFLNSTDMGMEDLYLYDDTQSSILMKNVRGTLRLDYVRIYKRLFFDTEMPEEETEAEEALSVPGISISFNESDEPFEDEEDYEEPTVAAEIAKNDSITSMPVWIAAEVPDSTEQLLVRADLPFRFSDVILVLMTAAGLIVLFFTLLATMLINVITSFINQGRASRMFFTDLTTKGRNRIWFLYRGEQAIRSHYAAKHHFAVVDLCLVKYRSFCVCHSLTEGEQLLSRLYSRICMTLGKRELCAHTADGSFALLLQYDTEEALVQRIRELFEQLARTDTVHSLTFHAGIDLVTGTEDRRKRRELDIEEEYTNACTACATLDGSDESATALFDQKLVDAQRWVDTVTECQRTALEQEQFVVYYQPKYDPQTNTLCGAEALIRWQSPEHGFVSPGRFIPIFEKNGFITEIDHYMVSHVARDQRRWLDAGFRCVPVSVNVSRAHFIESNLAEQIRDMVDAEGTPHELIEIELTESAFFDDKKAMIRTILRLKEYGFAVSMDDFGSGYSSLNSLKDMPLDVLKLDADFFRGEEAGTDRGEIVVSEAIKLAKNLHMRTVAEGVEAKEQVEFLASQGCDMIQGYYYAKPMPGMDYEQRMRAQREVPDVPEVAPEPAQAAVQEG